MEAKNSTIYITQVHGRSHQPLISMILIGIIKVSSPAVITWICIFRTADRSPVFPFIFITAVGPFTRSWFHIIFKQYCSWSISDIKFQQSRPVVPNGKYLNSLNIKRYFNIKKSGLNPNIRWEYSHIHRYINGIFIRITVGNANYCIIISSVQLCCIKYKGNINTFICIYPAFIRRFRKPIRTCIDCVSDIVQP